MWNAKTNKDGLRFKLLKVSGNYTSMLMSQFFLTYKCIFLKNAKLHACMQFSYTTSKHMHPPHLIDTVHKKTCPPFIRIDTVTLQNRQSATMSRPEDTLYVYNLLITPPNC